jgi:hypothetical protein
MICNHIERKLEVAKSDMKKAQIITDYERRNEGFES